MQDAIEAALRRLNPPKSKEVHVQQAIAFFSVIDSSGDGSAPSRYAPLGRKATQTELDAVVKAMTKLAEKLESLHEPSIIALAEAGLHEVRLKYPAHLRELSDQFRQIDLGKVSENPKGAVKVKAGQESQRIATTPRGGRPQNLRAQAVASHAAHYFKVLTGKKPTTHYNEYADGPKKFGGPFFDLVADLFKAIGLKENPEHFVRLAVREASGKGRKPSKK